MKPALTAEEWQDYRTAEQIVADFIIVGKNGAWQPDAHATAALSLHGRPFGFTREDVPNLRVIADFLDLLSEDKTAEMHARLERVLSGAKLRDIADRIEALLPPEKEGA